MKKTVYGFVIAVAVLLAGCDQVTDAITTPGNGDGDFVAVTSITLSETSRVKGEAIDLNALAVVVPTTATHKDIAWFVTDAFVPVTGITWTAPAGKTAGEAFEITEAEVAPNDATHSAIVWSVAEGSAVSATVSGTTVTPQAAGVLTLTATIANGTAEGTGYTQDFEITIAAAVEEEEEEEVPTGYKAIDSAVMLAKIGVDDNYR